jgi:hypothetical protein
MTRTRNTPVPIADAASGAATAGAGSVFKEARAPVGSSPFVSRLSCMNHSIVVRKMSSRKGFIRSKSCVMAGFVAAIELQCRALYQRVNCCLLTGSGDV